MNFAEEQGCEIDHAHLLQKCVFYHLDDLLHEFWRCATSQLAVSDSTLI